MVDCKRCDGQYELGHKRKHFQTDCAGSATAELGETPAPVRPTAKPRAVPAQQPSSFSLDESERGGVEMKWSYGDGVPPLVTITISIDSGDAAEKLKQIVDLLRP